MRLDDLPKAKLIEELLDAHGAVREKLDTITSLETQLAGVRRDNVAMRWEINQLRLQIDRTESSKRKLQAELKLERGANDLITNRSLRNFAGELRTILK